MTIYFRLAVLLATVVTTVTAQTDGIQLQQNFDLQRYLGTWYEVYHPDDPLFKIGTDVQMIWSRNPSGAISVINRQWIQEDNQWQELRGSAVVPYQNQPAQMIVRFPNVPDLDYRVLFTNYTNISVVYTASDYLNYGTIYSRTPNPTEQTSLQAFRVLNNRVGLSRNFFVETPQGVALYDFEPSLPSTPSFPNFPPSIPFPPMPFPTPDSSVQLQENFNLQAFMGKWYEIFRHKSVPFETGSDITATYMMNLDGTVLVTNREWAVRQNRWNVANAIARVVSPARLEMIFANSSKSSDLRVLYTDYANIAVLFAVTDSGQQYGWILARDFDTSDETDSQAFNVMQQRTNLRRSDFIETDHGVADLASLFGADIDTNGNPVYMKPLGRLTNQAKCNYQVASSTCIRYIGRYIVFDRRTGKCGVQSSACNAGAVSRYAFNAMEECITACNANN